ncbi:GNAT family N-acetyltransferase [Trichlorobacter lovleyi]|uniref:GNAT family N-acetyltransferase n=1 Tax=Trichlorobacter lovleyi TaxID=313985 RepID=UPI0022408D91|nr:GNAT family N-acetyltransferase [Trichlorobacter lovleyi]QOX78075.1 GNAT family N-acetyltransferase [Trichlorobacter lovleyi]
MPYEIRFADSADAEVLQGIFLESDMDLAGEIEEHIVISTGDRIIGGGMLTQTDQDLFHLIVFAISEHERTHGLGRLLLDKLLQQPWDFCHGGSMPGGGSYQVTTVAKGKSAGFYGKLGFVSCGFSDLAAPFAGQCDDCPEAADCHPVAMRCSCSIAGADTQGASDGAVS